MSYTSIGRPTAPTNTEIGRPTPSNTSIGRPTAPSNTEIGKPNIFGYLLLENGAFCLNEAGGYYTIDDSSYRCISKPNIPTYTNITKPS